MNKEIKHIKLFIFIFLTVFTLVIGWSLISDIRKEKQNVLDFAQIEGESSYNKDLLYRRWATMHGGVYVPMTDETPANPYLKDIPERDITTPSGKKLTLMNPAYMTRQAFEIAGKVKEQERYVPIWSYYFNCIVNIDWLRLL